MKSSSPNKKNITAAKKSSASSVSKTSVEETAAKSGEALIKSPNLFPVVGIGASAGGLDAFKKLLKAIPEDSGMAYVLVQHLDPNHESMLPDILQKVTKIPVLEITDDIKVQPDHIYVIPSNKMMVATDGVLLLAPRPAKSKTERNLPIDLFFTSLAEVHLEHAIGVVLSGTASDGTQGLKAIKDHGGITFAQDEASAEYDGMPHNAILAGVVDFVLPPGDIPKKLLEITSKTILSDAELQNIPKQEEDIFRQILSLLRIRKGVDFTYYKQTTVRRRILRRMVVNKNEETDDYLKFLRLNNQEQDLLYQDMLIPVTSFFRDKKTFENLCNHVFPTILKNKIPGEITRIWVAGCSTGQEVYSFAICFKEFLGDDHERIQIFGTDLSEPAIIKARTGLYEKSEVDTVSPERLKEYFTKNNGGYQVNKSIRDMCVFAHHNFLKDPPFGKMDCISCRNVLIYMEPYLQKKALTTFHYALNPKGFLLLGKSETTSGVPELFAAVEKNDKLYTRKNVPGRFMHIASQRSEQILNRPPDSSKSETIRTDFQKTADDILLTKYTPAGVVVNETMDIVHFRGNTANYLEQAPGKPSHNLLMMAKNGLGFELRNILHKVKADKVPVVKENIPLSINGNLHHISIEAIPLPNTLEPYYLILFHDNNLNDTDGPSAGAGGINNKKKVSAKTKKDEKDIQIQLLEQELAQAREDMRSITEDQEASNEELQSANEELLSGSEELQSLNEELETSKEELQSTNEELTVLNHELIGLNEQLTDARNYSESIVATLYQPLLVLDKHLRVKTANKAFYKTFNVNEQETEGVLIYDLGNRQWNIPELRTLLEEILPQKKQITDYEVTHNFLSIGERVILLSALEITREKKEEKLILLSIEDITERKLAQKRLEENEHRYHMMLMNSPFAFSIMKGKDMVVTLANDLMKNFWGKGEQVEGKTLLQVLPELIDQPFPAMIDKVYTSGEPVNANEILARLNRNGIMEDRYFNIVYQPHFETDKTISGVITIAHEVTNQVLARKLIEDSNKRYDMMVMQSPFAFAVLKSNDMVITLANDSIKEMWGKGKEIEGKPLLEVLPEIKDQQFPELLKEVYTTGIPYYANESFVQLVRNGKMEDVYFNFVYQPYREADETISGVAIIATEVTPQAILNKKIKASEEKFKLLVLQAPVAICVLRGENYAVEVINKGMMEMWDTTLEEALNKPLFDVLPELRDQGIKELLDNVYHTGERYVAEELAADIMRNGKLESIFVKFVYEPMHEADGSISGVMTLAHEITEQVVARKKIEESEAQFNTLANNIQNLAWMANADGWIFWYNNRWYEYTGTTPEEMKGWGWKSVHDPEQLPAVLERWQHSISTGESFEMVFPLRGTDKLFRPFLTRVIPMKDEAGKVIRWVGTNTDISEEKKLLEITKESEERFRQMAELMPQKVWTSDAEGNKNYFNKTLLDYAGKSFEELEGSGWQQIIHPDDWEENKVKWEESISTGKDYVAENRLLREDGKYLWHLTQAVALKSEDGKIKTWVGAKTEIHEQKEQKEVLENAVIKRTLELQEANKELEQKNQELFLAKEKLLSEYSRSLIEASLDPMVTINPGGKITDMNQATVDCTGVSRENLTGTNFFEYFTEPQKASDVYKDVFKKGTVTNSPLTLKHVDGKLTNVLLNGSVYKNEQNNVVGVVLVARDVTEEKRVATELSEAIVFAEMATLIAEEAKQKAEEATHLAEDAVTAKQQFLSNMSHEIRTPMNAIIGFTKVILKTDLTAKQREYLNAIKLSGNSLIVLINDILDLAKVDAGKMTFEQIPFKMSSSISAMVNLFETKIQEKNLELIKEYDERIPEVLLGDPVRLHQIILNLLSNAVKFTTKGNITVSARLADEDDKKVTVDFTISDMGIGIAEDKIEMVFQNFHQASSETSRLYGGTGLGLAIVKKLVESQGGTIRVKSKVNEGSVFSFTLNFQKTTAKVELDAELIELDSEIENIKVLVVEDMSLNQLLMKTILDEFGFERDIAANGKIALEKMQHKTYDIILMDLQMPEMNGFEATEHIRNNLHSKIPIIALTADVTTVDLAKCKAAGMNDYIAKPVDEKLLYNKIVGLVKKTTPFEQKKKKEPGSATVKELSYINLAYLYQHTKSNKALIREMISIYIDQTPPLVTLMKESIETQDWQTLYAAVHKMIPSFAIMGIDSRYELMAKHIQDYARERKETVVDGGQADTNKDGTGLPEIVEMITEIENMIQNAIVELTAVFVQLNKNKDE